MSAVLDTITGTELGNPGAHSTVVKLDDAEHASSLARGPLRTAVPCIALRLNKHGNTAVYGVEPDSDLIGKVAPGDVVVKVDGRPTEARTPAEVRELLAGPFGSLTAVGFARPLEPGAPLGRGEKVVLINLLRDIPLEPLDGVTPRKPGVGSATPRNDRPGSGKSTRPASDASGSGKVGSKSRPASDRSGQGKGSAPATDARGSGGVRWRETGPQRSAEGEFPSGDGRGSHRVQGNVTSKDAGGGKSARSPESSPPRPGSGRSDASAQRPGSARSDARSDPRSSPSSIRTPDPAVGSQERPRLAPPERVGGARDALPGTKDVRGIGQEPAAAASGSGRGGVASERGGSFAAGGRAAPQPQPTSASSEGRTPNAPAADRFLSSAGATSGAPGQTPQLARDTAARGSVASAASGADAGLPEAGGARVQKEAGVRREKYGAVQAGGRVRAGAQVDEPLLGQGGEEREEWDDVEAGEDGGEWADEEAPDGRKGWMYLGGSMFSALIALWLWRSGGQL